MTVKDTRGYFDLIYIDISMITGIKFIKERASKFMEKIISSRRYIGETPLDEFPLFLMT
jgi:hypothetical protein